VAPEMPLRWRLARVVCNLSIHNAFSYHTKGLENIPAAGGAVLAANHQSWFDPVLVGLHSPRPIRFMARRTLFRWPLGPLIRFYYAYPVDRGGDPREAITRTLETLAAGELVLVFVEGTRTRDGKLQPVRTGTALLAARARVPVVPVYIGGAWRAWPRETLMPRWGRAITVRFGRPIAVGEKPAGVSSHEHYRQIQTAISETLTALERQHFAELAERRARAGAEEL